MAEDLISGKSVGLKKAAVSGAMNALATIVPAAIPGGGATLTVLRQANSAAAGSAAALATVGFTAPRPRRLRRRRRKLSLDRWRAPHMALTTKAVALA
jgi:hypothetical protein